jgi:hypothetical protein
VRQTTRFGKVEVRMSRVAMKRSGLPCELRYLSGMSFNDVLAELPGMTFGQRQMLIRCALELDDPPLDEDHGMLVETRLAAQREAPGEAMASDEMKVRLRGRFPG